MSAFASSSSKRQKSNLGSALRKPPGPDYRKGIEYWDNIEASVDGVLGGFGNGPVPHVDQLSSRLFLLSLLPRLHTFPSPLTPSPPTAPPTHRLTALDIGAGIGRVTQHVLLPLFEDVVLTEPVDKFVRTARSQAAGGGWRDLQAAAEKGEELGWGRGKRVWFVRNGLQSLDPRWPGKGAEEDLGVVGRCTGGEAEEGFGRTEGEVKYDTIWCQWALGHVSHDDLVGFLRRSRLALRDEGSLIFVKENCCEDGPGGKAREFLDEEDSSLTRSEGRWLEAFKEAGLEVIKTEVQDGLPEELFVVRTWALQ